jgi:hypothetical protein
MLGFNNDVAVEEGSGHLIEGLRYSHTLPESTCVGISQDIGDYLDGEGRGG